MQDETIKEITQKYDFYTTQMIKKLESQKFLGLHEEWLTGENFWESFKYMIQHGKGSTETPRQQLESFCCDFVDHLPSHELKLLFLGTNDSYCSCTKDEELVDKRGAIAAKLFQLLMTKAKHQKE